MSAAQVVPFDDKHGVGSLSEAVGLAIQDAYAGVMFEDPTFERGTDAVMTVLRERAVAVPQPDKPGHPLPARSYVEVGDILTNLCTIFGAARQRRNLTTRQAAVQLGVAPSTVSRIETGGYPSVAVIERILGWLEEDCATCKADAHGMIGEVQS
jgi:hypothetical protein